MAHLNVAFLVSAMAVLAAQSSGQGAIRGLPCIKRLHQLYCRNQGETYPENQILDFIDLNKALTKRMFGEYSPPGDLFEEVPAFPDIQDFNTVDFPEYLRPKDDFGLASSFDNGGFAARRSVSNQNRPRFNASVTSRARAQSTARSSLKARTGNTRNQKRGTTFLNGTVRSMGRVQPSRSGNTRLPLDRLSTKVPSNSRNLYPNNVFLNNPDEPLPSASQSNQRRQPGSDQAANQRSTVGGNFTAQPIRDKGLPCKGRGCGHVASSIGTRYNYPEPVTKLALPKFGGQPSRNKRAAKRRIGSRPSDDRPPKIGKTSKHLVDSCESQLEVTTPRWAANSAGKIRAIVNTEHFPQAIQQETCKGKTTRHCRGDCICEQKYAYHRLLAYDPNNECKGIFIDWFLFPSCCVCRCPP